MHALRDTKGLAKAVAELGHSGVVADHAIPHLAHTAHKITAWFVEDE